MVQIAADNDLRQIKAFEPILIDRNVLKHAKVIQYVG